MITRDASALLRKKLDKGYASQRDRRTTAYYAHAVMPKESPERFRDAGRVY